jgi:hypothetical protein
MGTRTPKPVAQLLDTNHAAIRIQLVGVYFLHFFIVDIKFLLYFIFLKKYYIFYYNLFYYYIKFKHNV